ncbi:MAG: hypothetical protein M3082_16515, partial [Candidatus Dormibacteraeota bacterium]|nr:hypothetical protein [Candidatus Dormibacteraeota bacterium]
MNFGSTRLGDAMIAGKSSYLQLAANGLSSSTGVRIGRFRSRQDLNRLPSGIAADVRPSFIDLFAGCGGL